MHQPIIRPGAVEDVDVLVEFNQEMARETEARELPSDVVRAGVRAVLEHPHRGFYLLATAGEQVAAGLLVTMEWSDWRNGVFWWIQSVYVRPGFRRQGLYRELYLAVKQRAQQAGNVCGFRLYVEKHNAIAQQVYRSLGMSETRYMMYEEGC